MKNTKLELGKEYQFNWKSPGIIKDLETLREYKENCYYNNYIKYDKNNTNTENLFKILTDARGVGKLISASELSREEFFEKFVINSNFKPAEMLEGLAFFNSFSNYSGLPIALLGSEDRKTGYHPILNLGDSNVRISESWFEEAQRNCNFLLIRH